MRRAASRPGSGEARSHSTSAGLTTQKSRSISPARAHVRSANSMRSKRDGMTWDLSGAQNHFSADASTAL